MLVAVQWLSAIAALAAAALWFASTRVKPTSPEEAGFGDLPIDTKEGGFAIDLAMIEVRVLKKQTQLNRYAAGASAIAAALQAIAIMIAR